MRVQCRHTWTTYIEKDGIESIIQMRVNQKIGRAKPIGNASASSASRNTNQASSSKESKEQTHEKVVFELHIGSYTMLPKRLYGYVAFFNRTAFEVPPTSL